MDEEHSDQEEQKKLLAFTGRVMPNGHIVKDMPRNKPRRRKRRLAPTEPQAPGMGEGKSGVEDLTEAESRRLREWSKANPACAERIYMWESARRILRGESTSPIPPSTADESEERKRRIATLLQENVKPREHPPSLVASRDIIIVCGAGKDLGSILRAVGKQALQHKRPVK